MLSSHIDNEYKLVIMSFTGPVTVKELNQNFDNFTHLDDFKFNMNSLIFIEGSTPNLNANDMISHSEYINTKGNIRGDNFKIALVSQDINWHRLINLFKVSSKNKSYEFRYYDNSEEATQWLLKENLSKETFFKESQSRRNDDDNQSIFNI